MSTDSLFIGYDADEQPTLLGAKDQRAHLLCSGSSGSGKSRMVEHCLRQFLDTSQPFILIDPEGTLYNAVLDYAAHHVLLDRKIIQLNFSSPGDRIIPYNPFKRRLDTDLSVQVNECVRAILHAWNQQNAENTPTLSRVLTLIFTVLIRHNLGLKQALHLIDPNPSAIRQYLTKDLQSPLIEREWQALEALRRGERRAEILSTINRLMPFLNSESLTRFMSVPGESLDWNEVFKGASVIVNIAESGSLSEEAGRMAGALVVNDIYRAALRRETDELGEDPEPMYRVVIDEWAELVSLDVLKGLDRTRKRSVFFWLLHQRFGQLGADFDANLAEAAITNCKIKVVMGGMPVKTCRFLAEELFIAELDPEKIKLAIWVVKFWPKYGRDKVYTKTESEAVTSGVLKSLGHGSMITDGSSYFSPGSDWFGMGAPAGTNVTAASGYSDISVEGRQTSSAHAVTEGEADIPTIVPIPFRELSSVQTYSIDEQIWLFAAALKEQFPRHAFLKVHDRKTTPMLVPFVKRLYTPPENKAWYVNELYDKQGALSIEEADRRIAAVEDELARKAEEPEAAVEEESFLE